MQAKNIDELIVIMENLVKKCEAENSRMGYFAALYHTVTCRVKQGMLTGEFEDNARMERLDVTFANRYLAAMDNWEATSLMSGCWNTAFESGKRSSLLLMHHLLLGINAHINLDLGVVAVEIMQPNPLKGIQKDFNAINRIIAELTAELVNKINRISPLLSLLGLHATNYNSVFIQFALSSARDGAWVFAEELSEKTGQDHKDYIAERDGKIKVLADGIIHANFWLRLSIGIIRLFEWRKPSRIIKELFKAQQTYFSIEDHAVVAVTTPAADPQATQPPQTANEQV